MFCLGLIIFHCDSDGGGVDAAGGPWDERTGSQEALNRMNLVGIENRLVYNKWTAINMNLKVSNLHLLYNTDKFGGL